MIRCFDVSNPGKNYTNFPTSKSKRDLLGQKGIISSIVFNPDRSGSYAAGSYSPSSVGIYVENAQGSVLDIPNLDSECGKGITHMKWSPCGNYLWIGGRKHDQIVCWDLRNTRSQIGRYAVH